MCSHSSNGEKWELGEGSPPDSRHRNRKSGTTNWRQTASLLYYIIPSGFHESKGRERGTNSSSISPAHQSAVVRPVIFKLTLGVMRGPGLYCGTDAG